MQHPSDAAFTLAAQQYQSQNCFVFRCRWNRSIWVDTLPYSLNVRPTNVRFANRGAAGQTYSFRFTNRSDKDLYASQLKFRIHSRTLAGKDFLINIPAASRKAYGEGAVGAQRFVDIQGLLCHGSYQRPVFSISVFHLSPHESREITITNVRAGIAKVGATTGFFSTPPQPLDVNGNASSTPFRSDEALSDCQSFGFLVDAHEHEGMYWFDREGGKLDGKIVPRSWAARTQSPWEAVWPR